MQENDITLAVMRAAFRVHTALGPGLFEIVYEAALAHELKKAGLHVERQVEMPVEYDGVRLEVGFRLDLLIERKVIVELKSVEALHPVHHKQLLTYLKLSGCKVGQLINFNVPSLKDHIIRIANGI